MFMAAGFKQVGDEGDDDPWAKMWFKLAGTIIQPWSIMADINSVKNISPTSLNLLYNSLTGVSQLFARGTMVAMGYEDSMTNDNGNIPGLKAIRRNLPYGRAIESLWDQLEDERQK
jgi:hypothetical protein